MRPAYLQINLAALRHNLREIRRHVGPRVALIAVVKADAYGHGAVPVSRAALEEGAEMLAVALLEEGQALREAGILAPILVMGALLPEQAEELVAWDLTPAIMNWEFAQALSEAAQKAGKTVPCHLKVDTGMCRLGAREDNLPELLPRLAALPGLRWEGIFSHLSSPTENKEATETQIRRFRRAIATAEAILGPLRYQHLSGSGGISLYAHSYFNAVRPGEMMYGLVAGVPPDRQLNLQEIMSLQAKITFLKPVRQGECVSYGGTWQAPCDTTLAVVPVGYADGYPRSLSGKTHVLIQGQRHPIVGRICMDCFLVDVGPEPSCTLGDEVVIFGRQGKAEIRISELSELAQTINQEIVSRMGSRLPRVYVDECVNEDKKETD